VPNTRSLLFNLKLILNQLIRRVMSLNYFFLGGSAMVKRKHCLEMALALVCCVLMLPDMASAGMGQVLYERWDGDGTAESMLTESSTPDYTEILSTTEWGVGDDDSTDNYRGRITAWLIPPVTGNYTFWIVTDDNGCLWLSTDHDPANAQLIAQETTWAGEDEWGGVGDEARSASIMLEAGKAYWLRGGYQEGGGGDHIRIAWASTQAAIAEHTIIKGQYLSNTNPFYASLPDPADGAVNVMVEDVQLSWAAPVLLVDSTYTVYLGSDPNEELPLLVSDLTEPAVSAGNLDTDTTYLWRVDVYDPNEGGNPTVNAGPVWSFTTMPAIPVILVQPQYALVYAGETTSFTISAYSANSEPLTYEWFKETAPGIILSDTDTLTITDAQLDDEGIYKCSLTNAFGDVTSDVAGLFIKRAIGHWPFDGTLEDIVGGNHGTYLGGGSESYDTGVPDLGGSALLFNGQENRAITVPSIAVTSGFFSIAFWDFSPPDILNDGYMLASGSPAGWETMYMRRWEDSWIGGLNRYVGCVGLADPDEETAAEISFGYVGPYQRDQWHHHVMTYDHVTGIAAWYVDGAKAGEYSGAEFTAFEPEIYIGDRNSGGRAFEGLIDDLYIYSYPLTPIEVAVEYTKVTGGEVCMGYPEYDFNEDCRIDILDLEAFLQEWLQCNIFPSDHCF
jgi:hypothetical protein